MTGTWIATVSAGSDPKEAHSAIAPAGFDGIALFDRVLICRNVSPASPGGATRAADRNG